jgi:hypothetical protein
MTENKDETEHEETNEEKIRMRVLKKVPRSCAVCVFNMRRRVPDDSGLEPCWTMLKLRRKGLTEICQEFLMNPEPGTLWNDPRDVAIIRAGKWGDRSARGCGTCVFRIRPNGMACNGRYRHDVVLGGKVCLDFKVGTPELKERPCEVTKPSTSKRFVFDGSKWICSACDYTSTSKETMKSHFKRKHPDLLDPGDSIKPQEETPRTDGKFDGEDSGGLG